MESYSGISGEEEDEHMELPPGFRFHPTDEELITHYLAKKVINNNFTSKAMGEADFNKVEPWDLPSKAKMGEKEWYFFCVRDRKYPNGERTNRATKAGYWKATGKDKEIYRAKKLVGMKKTLVFYKGRAPKGQKTNWIMHEYRLEGMYVKVNLPKTAQNEWVISRVFKKFPNMNHHSIPSFASQEELQQPFLPSLTDSSPYGISEIKSTNSANQSYTTCFSNHPLVTEHKNSAITTTTTTTATSTFLTPSKFPPQRTLMEQTKADFQFADSLLMQDEPPVVKFLLEGNKNIPKEESSQDTGLSVCDNGQNPSGPIDLECLWDY